MHIIQTIRELIVLANKAKVLLGLHSDSEPVITFQIGPKEQGTITFKSTCFPFFPEAGFYTFPESQLDLIADKCRCFISNLEKGTNLVVEERSLLFEKSKTPSIKISRKRLPSVVIHLDGKLYRYKIILCDAHKNNPNTRFLSTDKSAKSRCNCRLVREEES